MTFWLLIRISVFAVADFFFFPISAPLFKTHNQKRRAPSLFVPLETNKQVDSLFGGEAPAFPAQADATRPPPAPRIPKFRAQREFAPVTGGDGRPDTVTAHRRSGGTAAPSLQRGRSTGGAPEEPAALKRGSSDRAAASLPGPFNRRRPPRGRHLPPRPPLPGPGAPLSRGDPGGQSR